MKKIILTFAITFSVPFWTYAGILINEVMYDLSGTDTDREWVELHNDGTEPVTIVTGGGAGSFRFVDNSPHIINLHSASAVIPAGGFAVIAKKAEQFILDNPSYSGILFTSAISFPNTNATLSIRNGEGSTLDTISYSASLGANGDGNSLQKMNNSWVPATPTPGASNSGIATPIASTTEDTTVTTSNIGSSSSSNSSLSTHSSPAEVSDGKISVVFEVSAGRDRLTSVGNIVTFQAFPIKTQGISEQIINYEWSFGDGAISQSSLVNHSYKFPGDYVVVLNARALDKEAVSRIKVKVLSPDLKLDSVPGGFQVTNKSKNEINMEGWSFLSDNKKFVIPKDTIIQPNSSVVFPNETTRVFSEDVELLNPIGKIIAFIKKPIGEREIVVQRIDVVSPVELAEVEVEVSKIATLVSELVKPNYKEVDKADIPIFSETVDFGRIEDSLIESVESLATPVYVFEAEPSKGLVSRVFALPIKAFDFLWGMVTN